MQEMIRVMRKNPKAKALRKAFYVPAFIDIRL